jgi:hypothetical protein
MPPIPKNRRVPRRRVEKFPAAAVSPPHPTPVTPPPAPESSAPAAVPPLKWPWYFLSLFIPCAGIVVGLFLYDHDSRETRRVGRNSLLIGFVVWILLPAVMGVLFALLTALAAMDFISGLVPPGN